MRGVGFPTDWPSLFLLGGTMDDNWIKKVRINRALNFIVTFAALSVICFFFTEHDSRFHFLQIQGRRVYTCVDTNLKHG